MLTTHGQALLETAPQLMQRDFIQRFQSLDGWEQTLLLSSLQRLSKMMTASDLADESSQLTLNKPSLPPPNTR